MKMTESCDKLVYAGDDQNFLAGPRLRRSAVARLDLAPPQTGVLLSPNLPPSPHHFTATIYGRPQVEAVPTTSTNRTNEILRCLRASLHRLRLGLSEDIIPHVLTRCFYYHHLKTERSCSGMSAQSVPLTQIPSFGVNRCGQHTTVQNNCQSGKFNKTCSYQENQSPLSHRDKRFNLLKSEKTSSFGDVCLPVTLALPHRLSRTLPSSQACDRTCTGGGGVNITFHSIVLPRPSRRFLGIRGEGSATH
ncbi:hypothetical protein J6590_001120 [Homalodisca vitripennis]|nr:hypothetical protein J6590_001120 [Homalodisca vitripennis]